MKNYHLNNHGSTLLVHTGSTLLDLAILTFYQKKLKNHPMIYKTFLCYEVYLYQLLQNPAQL